jgi:hypothetical protein
MASVQLPLVIRVQRPTLERVVLTVKRSDHQTPASQLLVSQTLDSQQQDSQMLVNQTLVNQHNKVQLSTRMTLSAATKTTMEFQMHST